MKSRKKIAAPHTLYKIPSSEPKDYERWNSMIDSEGLKAIITVMNDPQSTPLAKECGVAALRNIAFGSDENKTDIVQAEGHKAIITVMNHPNSTPLAKEYGVVITN